MLYILICVLTISLSLLYIEKWLILKAVRFEIEEELAFEKYKSKGRNK